METRWGLRFSTSAVDIISLVLTMLSSLAGYARKLVSISLSYLASLASLWSMYLPLSQNFGKEGILVETLTLLPISDASTLLLPMEHCHLGLSRTLSGPSPLRLGCPAPWHHLPGYLCSMGTTIMVLLSDAGGPPLRTYYCFGGGTVPWTSRLGMGSLYHIINPFLYYHLLQPFNLLLNTL